jgi:ribosomal protein L29
MKRKAESQVDAPGQDSFLDVVCNLVGILIVLVMLIAAQAKRGMIAAATANPSSMSGEASPAETEAKAAEGAAAAIEASVQELQAKINRENLEVAVREQERDQYQVLVTVAEQRMAEYRSQLSDDEKSRYDLEQQLVSSKNELAVLSTAKASAIKPKPHVLEHLPTPMARTVFGTEVHFRLLGRRLAYVPWDEMLERLKNDARNHLSKLRDNPRVELSLPEIAGWGARYILRRSDVEVETRVGTARHSGVELEYVYLVPTEPNLGQPIGQALGPGSEFRGRIAALKPQSTTITIWVYPDSFDDFRALKAELFKLGFLTAARPMPMDEPIAGSPSGSRSSAE